ncbi:MAG TPA: hypothetical protein VMT22_07550 [Terriglobales bacterium]|nr:hypothetical protein [Terriglobales bacterium]
MLIVAAIAPAHGFDDGAWVDALVDVERNRRHFERSPLGFAGPNQLRVEMRVVGVGFLAALFVRLGIDQTDRRIVRPLLALVRVLLYGLFLGSARRLLCLRHLTSPDRAVLNFRDLT